ncbi:MAG: hypothetical protein Q7R42_05655 [Candidatus Planktophila sp.]|nr:hypothetical protein [Candidatus Planktophila sp.]
MPEVKFSRIEQTLKIPDKVAKFVNLHTSSGDYMRNMFSEQFGYGHREILLKYCGLDFSTQLLGNLQHGVMLHHSYLDFRTPRYFGMRKSQFWVFSKEYEKLGRSLGNENVTAIGAPWLYLRDSVECEPQPVQKPEGILVMPGHSSGPYNSIASVQQKRARAKAFRQIVGTQKATVCLHATDFCNPDTTEAFLDEGFKVICPGSSNVLPYWAESGNRARTLHKIMSLMNSHTHLLTDRFGTHIFYAIDMGLKIGIFPEISELSPTRDLSGRKHVVDFSITDKEEFNYLRENIPEAINQFTESQKYQEISNLVLGRDAVMSPENLLETLDYRKHVYPISDIQPW